MEKHAIREVAVLGAGIMGSGLAAHLAGAGLSVLLLDQAAESEDRNQLSRSALDKLRQSQPPMLFHLRDAERIQVGNFEEDLTRAAAMDWVIEAVAEDLAVKRDLFARLEPLLGENTVVSSNTSGLSLRQMTEGLGDRFKKHFLVTHFFNPVRHMQLLEVIPGPETDPSVVRHIVHLAEESLGKSVILGKDTPNFVANRMGLYSLFKSVQLADELGLSIEQVDALLGTPLGRPKSAVFRTMDWVGLDTLFSVAEMCFSYLQADPQRAVFSPSPVLLQLLQHRNLGEKTGAGFYKKTRDGLLVWDATTQAYRPVQRPDLPVLERSKNAPLAERVEILLQDSGVVGEFVRRVVWETLAYASHRIGGQDPICDSIVELDQAMEWGFGWEVGPFALWDMLGVRAGLDAMRSLGVGPAPWVEHMLAQGRGSFYAGSAHQQTVFEVGTGNSRLVPRNPKHMTIDMVRVQRSPVMQNAGATLWDLGEGVGCFSLSTKKHTLDEDVIALLERTLDQGPAMFSALVVGGDPSGVFSVGANLKMIAMLSAQKKWSQLEQIIHRFQQANQRIRYSRIPVVMAAEGLTLGGGAELALHGAAIRAHAELYMGLVETGVGLIPAGGGCKEMLGRQLGNVAEGEDVFWRVKRLFDQIALAKVSTSAEDARSLGYLSERDGISMHRDALLHDAKQCALGLALAGYRPPRPRQYRLPGVNGFATLRSWLHNLRVARQIGDHDVTVGIALARVLTGGGTTLHRVLSEQDVLDLEREAFLQLCGEQQTQKRVQHVLERGKPVPGA